MTMQLEDCLRWQAESAQEQIQRLRDALGGNVNEEALRAMESLYRAGWNDCFKLARLHGVERL